MGKQTVMTFDDRIREEKKEGSSPVELFCFFFFFSYDLQHPIHKLV